MDSKPTLANLDDPKGCDFASFPIRRGDCRLDRDCSPFRPSARNLKCMIKQGPYQDKPMNNFHQKAVDTASCPIYTNIHIIRIRIYTHAPIHTHTHTRAHAYILEAVDTAWSEYMYFFLRVHLKVPSGGKICHSACSNRGRTFCLCLFQLRPTAANQVEIFGHATSEDLQAKDLADL